MPPPIIVAISVIKILLSNTKTDKKIDITMAGMLIISGMIWKSISINDITISDDRKR